MKHQLLKDIGNQVVVLIQEICQKQLLMKHHGENLQLEN